MILTYLNVMKHLHLSHWFDARTWYTHEKVNVNGGAMPLDITGCTGGRLMTTLLNELDEQGSLTQTKAVVDKQTSQLLNR